MNENITLIVSNYVFKRSNAPHGRIRNYNCTHLQEHLQNENGVVFHFNIHGTGRKTVKDLNGKNQYVDVIIGTVKGRTIFPLNQKDPAAWWGKTTGLIPLLLDKGVAVWPPNQTEEMASNAPLDGGYTIETYSSKFKDRLVTIQVEVIRCL